MPPRDNRSHPSPLHRPGMQRSRGRGQPGPRPHSFPQKSTGSDVRVQQAPAQCRDCLVALAHRFSQPLTALRGSIELGLLTEPVMTARHAALEQWLALTDELVRLVTALRELAGVLNLPGPLESVSLGELVAEITEELRGLWESRHVQTKIKARALRVWANRGCLSQVVLRLLHRAVMDTPKGGTIHITVSRRGECGCLTFSHPCLGTLPCELESAMDMSNPGVSFSQAAKEGGLDWVIVRSLVNAMGANLVIENNRIDERRFSIKILLFQEIAS